MAQNIYDDPAFFKGYAGLPRQTRGLAGAPEWPAVRALLPDLTGARVLDLGCGFGWFARFARAEGAAEVTAMDLSENMIARARAMTEDAAIAYVRGDLDALDLPQDGYDLAYSSLAFHYVEDFGRLIAALHRALAPGGRLVFTMEHPIFMASQAAGWITREDGRRSWPVDSYAREGRRVTRWFTDGVVKYHRRMDTTLNTLLDEGFAIGRIVEWHPSPAELDAEPALADEMERPMMLIVSAQR